MTRSKSKKHQESLVNFMGKSLTAQGREVLAQKPMMVIPTILRRADCLVFLVFISIE